MKHLHFPRCEQCPLADAAAVCIAQRTGAASYCRRVAAGDRQAAAVVLDRSRIAPASLPTTTTEAKGCGCGGA